MLASESEFHNIGQECVAGHVFKIIPPLPPLSPSSSSPLPPHSLAVAELLVMVENLNDNQPMFVQSGVMVEEVDVNVTEEQPAGTIVLVLEVRVGGCEGGRVEGRLDMGEGVKVGGCQELAYYVLSIPPLPPLPPLPSPLPPKAMDADGDLTPLTFEIAAGNDLNHFELNTLTQP